MVYDFPVFRSSVTSRKLTMFSFASVVVRRPFLVNILHISFFSFSFFFGGEGGGCNLILPATLNRRNKLYLLADIEESTFLIIANH